MTLVQLPSAARNRRHKLSPLTFVYRVNIQWNTGQNTALPQLLRLTLIA